jgi:hypothetical protein
MGFPANLLGGQWPVIGERFFRPLKTDCWPLETDFPESDPKDETA